MPVLTAKQNRERANGAAQERRVIAREIRKYLKDWQGDDGNTCFALNGLLRFVLRRAKDQ